MNWAFKFKIKAVLCLPQNISLQWTMSLFIKHSIKERRKKEGMLINIWIGYIHMWQWFIAINMYYNKYLALKYIKLNVIFIFHSKSILKMPRVANRYKKIYVTKRYMTKINGIWSRSYRRYAYVYAKFACHECGTFHNYRILNM